MIAYLEEKSRAIAASSRADMRELASVPRDHAVTRFPTGVDARYSAEIAPGAYWLFAAMPLADDEHYWVIRVDATRSASLTIDLDNTNTLPWNAWSCSTGPGTW